MEEKRKDEVEVGQEAHAQEDAQDQTAKGLVDFPF